MWRGAGKENTCSIVYFTLATISNMRKILTAPQLSITLALLAVLCVGTGPLLSGPYFPYLSLLCDRVSRT